jgi:hypothetical protein
LAKVVCPQARKAALLSEGVSGLEAALLVTAFISGIGVGKLRPSLRFYRKYQGR